MTLMYYTVVQCSCVITFDTLMMSLKLVDTWMYFLRFDKLSFGKMFATKLRRTPPMEVYYALMARKCSLL